jgi:predicted RNA-binding protein YlxR (DUF448 family)
MKNRKTPVRTCVACREEAGKKALIRLVRSADGTVQIDSTGKKPGRGAYIHASAECLANAVKGRKFDRALRTAVPADVLKELESVVLNIEDENQGA